MTGNTHFIASRSHHSLDGGAVREDDHVMTDISRDELNARLAAASEKLDGRINAMAEKTEGKIDAVAEKTEGKINAVAEKTDGQINAGAEASKGRHALAEEKWRADHAVLRTEINGRFDAFDAKMDRRFAEFRAELHESKAELIKWIVGTALAICTVAGTVMTFVLNNAVPKTAAAPPIPIVIYAQPAPTGPVAPAPIPRQ